MDKALLALNLYRLLSAGLQTLRQLTADDETLKALVAKARAEGETIDADDMRAFGQQMDDAKAALEAKHPWLANS